MRQMNEIFVAVKDTRDIEEKIDRLCAKYVNRQGTDYLQLRALFRGYCHDTIEVFEGCFATSLLGIIRCKEKVERFKALDNVDIGKATQEIVDMLWSLKSIVKAMVPIKDLPSCKKLTELSPEDIIFKAKDLVRNDIVKACAGVLVLGSKIGDAVTVERVRCYYDDRLSQLNEEIQIKGGTISQIEQFLLDKFNAEIGYCNIAILKAGIGITEELRGLADIGRKHIDKFENEFLKNGLEFLEKYTE